MLLLIALEHAYIANNSLADSAYLTSLCQIYTQFVYFLPPLSLARIVTIFHLNCPQIVHGSFCSYSEPLPIHVPIRERNFFQTQIWSRDHYPPFPLKPFIGFPLLWRRKQTPWWHGLARSGLCPYLHTHLLLLLTPGFELLWSSSGPSIVLSVTTLACSAPLSLLCFTRPTGLFFLQVSESISPSPGWLSYLSCPLGCLSTVLYNLLLSLHSSRL